MATTSKRDCGECDLCREEGVDDEGFECLWRRGLLRPEMSPLEVGATLLTAHQDTAGVECVLGVHNGNPSVTPVFLEACAQQIKGGRGRLILFGAGRGLDQVYDLVSRKAKRAAAEPVPKGPRRKSRKSRKKKKGRK